MIIAPLQYFGTGDIHFCQTIANKWVDEGYEVVWGALPHFVDGLNRAFPRVKFVDYRTLPIDYNRMDEHDSNGYRVIPLRWSVELMGVPYKDCMKSKYMLFDMDWQDWRKGAMWQRDEVKEMNLANIALRKYFAGTEIANAPYNLINDTFGSELKNKVRIDVINGLPNIYMSAIEGYSLFDWSLLIENATEIHTVSTSIIYILEMLDLKVPEIHLYNRPIAGQGFDNIDYILQKHKYIFHK